MLERLQILARLFVAHDRWLSRNIYTLLLIRTENIGQKVISICENNIDILIYNYSNKHRDVIMHLPWQRVLLHCHSPSPPLELVWPADHHWAEACRCLSFST